MVTPSPVAPTVNGLPVPGSWSAVPFDLGRVSLRDSVFTAKRDRVLAHLRTLDPDRILASFRRTAGLDDRGAVPPGGWDDSTGNLRGHYGGHLMTVLAQAYARSREPVFKERLDAVVSGLAECQQALATQVGEPGGPLPEATWGPGRFAGALVLSGEDQHLGLPDSTVDGATAVTLAGWVNLHELRPGARLFDFGTGSTTSMHLVPDTGTGPAFAITTAGVTTEQRAEGRTRLRPRRWTHVAATLGDGTATLYVDGVVVATTTGLTLTPADLGAPKDNWVGRSHDGHPTLAADLEQLHVHDRALPPQEVLALTRGPAEGGLVGTLAAYALDDGSGGVARDSSGRGWHAAVVTGVGRPAGPSHPGYLAAYPETQFDQLERLTPYPAIWAPWYTCHKILKGLLDAHTLTGNPTALKVAVGIGDWAHHRLHRLTREQLDAMWDLYIAGEFGGMNEALADLHALTGDAQHLATAALFDHSALLADLVADRDTLDGRHANQHLPQFLGHLRVHEQGVAGDRLAAARHAHAMVVPHRTYAHGGTGQGEVFRARGAIAATIASDTNAETCAAHNLLRLTRQLFLHRPDAALMDHYERTLVNQVLGSRLDADSDDDPLVAYMVPVGPGARREFGNLGTCCGGTGLENHTKYQDTVFARSPDHSTLWVNLPIPAELDWRERGLQVVQQNSWPSPGPTTLTVRGAGWLDLRVRVPRWATAGFALTLNGSQVETEVGDDGYALVAREWSDGDTLVVEVPHPLWLEPTPDDPDLQALFRGPVLLVALSESTEPLILPLDDTRLGRLQRDGDRVTLGDLRFEPMHHGTTSAYHAYHRRGG